MSDSGARGRVGMFLAREGLTWGDLAIADALVLMCGVSDSPV